MASVYGPRECSSRAKEEHDRSIVNCDVFMAPFAQVRVCVSMSVSVSLV